jgi:uncharacterized protein (TIGR02246 family)
MADAIQRTQAASDETELRELIARWSKAVRDQDLAGIRADHDVDLLMFDVPPPFLSRGLDAYMATWDTFFAWSAKPVEFDFHDVAITAGKDVAFATAIGRCRGVGSGEEVQLEFRLTMGFGKHDGRWRIVHEHHSLPRTKSLHRILLNRVYSCFGHSIVVSDGHKMDNGNPDRLKRSDGR